jgi:hypothetical protein
VAGRRASALVSFPNRRARGVTEVALGLMRRLEPGIALPAYERSLAQACADAPPPFGMAEYGDVYRASATDAGWLAVSLLTNADREGDGAQRLWSLAACTEDRSLSAQLKQHAIDESKHSRMYLRLVDLVFDGAVDADFRKELEALSPGYTDSLNPKPKVGSPFAHSVTVDDLIQMNIAEIRTTVHHLLQRPMLVLHCPRDRRPRLLKALDVLLRDEVRHVLYTGALIEAQAAQVGEVAITELFAQRVQDFNAVTRAELERRVFEGN